jgi:hypothetical protein
LSDKYSRKHLHTRELPQEVLDNLIDYKSGTRARAIDRAIDSKLIEASPQSNRQL